MKNRHPISVMDYPASMHAKHRHGQHHEQKLTPPEVARLFRVDVHKVLTWIRNGELRAVNVATKLGGRPRYRIDREDIAAFELRRQVQPPPPVIRRPRYKPDPGVIQFY